jgi:hypothetical protein
MVKNPIFPKNRIFGAWLKIRFFQKACPEELRDRIFGAPNSIRMSAERG